MRHELDPIGREHIEERRLLVVAVGVFRITRQTIAFLALCRVGLDSRKKAAADHLGIRLQKRKPVSVAIARQFVQP